MSTPRLRPIGPPASAAAPCAGREAAPQTLLRHEKPVEKQGWAHPRWFVARWLRASLADARRRWYAYGPALVLWSLASWRVLVDPTPHLPLLVNWTPSLPYTVVVLQGRPGALQRGDYIVFAFNGEAQRFYPGLRGQPFFKRVAGVPGDRITVGGRHVFVNGADVGWAKPQTFDHRPLEVIAPVVIPAGRYYVQGTGPDSFDSRYRLGGLVDASQILTKVRPLF